VTAEGNRGADARRRNLTLRVASAAVLVPVTLAAAYLGGWVFEVLCVLGALGILWEWGRLIGAVELLVTVPGGVAVAAAFIFTGLGYAAEAAAVVALGAVVAGSAAGLWGGPAGRGTVVRGMWAAAGVIYAGAAFFGPALIRSDAELGFAAFLFVALTVWATDTFAFAVGRAVGGPLLWPRVSPNKTWSGAFGGLFGGVAGGTLVAYADGLSRLAVVGVIALVLSALAQAGDLLESAIKRHFGAKDTSQLIPGHGGLMDRLDGFLVAAAAALLIGIVRQGTGAAAHGLLVW
jgi:phosphatidate cytidylyltransferase